MQSGPHGRVLSSSFILAPRRGVSTFAMHEVSEPAEVRDRPFDPSKTPVSSEAGRLVEAFLTLVGEMESRQRARRGADQQRHVQMASALVLDLAHLALTTPNKWLAVSLKKDSYSPKRRPAGFLTEAFIDLVRLLSGNPGVLEMRLGYQGHGGLAQGKRTTIRPGPVLIQMIDQSGIYLGDIGRDRKLRGDCIRLKATKVKGKSSYLAVPENDVTRSLRADMETINDWIARADLMWCGDDVDLGERFLRRVFNNGSFEAGGRMFGGFWMPKKDRVEDLLIEGHRAVSLDFGQMGVRSAYAAAGVTPPDGDLYAVPGLEKYRSGVKKTLSALLAADRLPTRFSKGIRTEGLFPFSMRFEHVYDAVAAYHPAITHLFGTGFCFRQMYEESCLLVDILLRLKEEGVVALPVHDSVVVGQHQLQAAEMAMKELFHRRLGMEGVVDITFPATTITFHPPQAHITMDSPDSPTEGGVR